MTAENTPTPAAPDTIVLIHGLWVTPRSWEKWVEHYEGRGYRVLAPAYPGFEVEVEALNEDPSPIETVTIPAVIEHLERIVGELDRAPIIMGHSAGGLFTQILLDHGYGAAGVAIDSVPAEGVRVTPVSQIRSVFPVLKNPANRHRAVGFTPEQFHYAFANTLSREESDKGLPALPHPSAGQLRVGRAPGQLHARSPGCLRQLQERKPGTIAVHCGWRRQPHASSGQPIERQALPPHQHGH
jgi:pimeloyl-ACP methyl ester carboxylesterase